jgi:hypothetical protein
LHQATNLDLLASAMSRLPPDSTHCEKPIRLKRTSRFRLLTRLLPIPRRGECRFYRGHPIYFDPPFIAKSGDSIQYPVGGGPAEAVNGNPPSPRRPRHRGAPRPGKSVPVVRAEIASVTPRNAQINVGGMAVHRDLPIEGGDPQIKRRHVEPPAFENGGLLRGNSILTVRRGTDEQQQRSISIKGFTMFVLLRRGMMHGQNILRYSYVPVWLLFWCASYRMT